MRILSSPVAMEMLQSSQRAGQASGNRARIERVEYQKNEQSNVVRHDLQEYKQKNLERPRDPQTVHQNNKAEKHNFYKSKDFDQLPAHQQRAVKTYLDNQRSADAALEGSVLLTSIDTYA